MKKKIHLLSQKTVYKYSYGLFGLRIEAHLGALYLNAFESIYKRIFG